jgi:class 3 adenylate cyclase
MGAGVHSGPVVVGNIGSQVRKKYGIVGASMNITQRIQGESAEGETVIAEPVIDKVRSRISAARSFSAIQKGGSTPVKLYAVNPGDKSER